MVDLVASEIDVTPLVVWAGHPDDLYIRSLFKRICRAEPDLSSRLEILRIRCRVLGDEQKAWGEKVVVKAL